MKIYNYDKKSGVFLSVSDAQENPKRNGEYLMPPNSTIVVPPECSDCEIPVFKDGFWQIVSDFRKQQKINLETLVSSEITDIGDLEDGYMLYSDYLVSELYLQEQERIKKLDSYNEIYDEIKALDKKRIRAICEPAVKDEESGETWLDYYNAQIKELREKLKEV